MDISRVLRTAVNAWLLLVLLLAAWTTHFLLFVYPASSDPWIFAQASNVASMNTAGLLPAALAMLLLSTAFKARALVKIALPLATWGGLFFWRFGGTYADAIRTAARATGSHVGMSPPVYELFWLSLVAVAFVVSFVALEKADRGP
ncbi:hypothetical protein [Lysobacter fragariae]